MVRTAALALLLAASAAPALAAPPQAPPAGDPQQLRFLAELRVEPTKNGTRIGADLQKLDPGRFIRVGMEWVRDEKNRPRRPRFKLVDLEQRRFVELELPLDQLPRTHTDLLGQSPPPEVVHYDGVGANKVVEVRRVDDLGLRTSIPVRLLFPGQDGVHPGFLSSEDGRLLVSPIPDRSGFPAGNGVRIFEVPDDVDSPATAGTSPEELGRAQAVVAAQRHAGPGKIQLHVDPAEEARTPAPTFAPIVVAPGGDVLFTGTRSGNSDGDYKPGRTKPVVVRLDPAGKRRWEVTLAKPGFEEQTGARVAATADGGCVAQIYSYVRAGGSPNTRLVKLDAKGKTLWELQLRGGGGLDTPLADRAELLADGSISLTGRIYPARNVEKRWTAVVGPDGKVLSDVTGE